MKKIIIILVTLVALACCGSSSSSRIQDGAVPYLYLYKTSLGLQEVSARIYKVNIDGVTSMIVVSSYGGIEVLNGVRSITP